MIDKNRIRKNLQYYLLALGFLFFPLSVLADPNSDADGDGVKLGPIYVPISVDDISFVIPISDNCPTVYNPDQANSDNDQYGNACDDDDDNDGVLDVNDAFPTDPNEWADNDGDGIGDNADTDDDGDGMPDSWELNYGLDPLATDALLDADGDGITNLDEFLSGTDPIDENSIPSSNAGYISGKFSVSKSGNAEYSIPVVVPPGTAQMQPSLSINYNSQTGNGLLGVGWHIGGLSAISRCPATLATDGFVDGVNYDNYDRYCLDGQRLIQIGTGSDTYGNFVEYRTEIDGFARIKSYGTAGSGPAKFRVWTKTGQIMEYGVTTDSRIEAYGTATVRVWAVNKITDTVGNYLTISYFESGIGEYRPNTIEYTGNTGTAPNNSIKFIYEGRNDITRQYIGGSLIKNTKRLKSIQTFEGANLVSNYQFSYGVGDITARSRLVSISRCSDSSGTNCLEPITFTWKVNPNKGYTTSSTLPPDILEGFPWLSTGEPRGQLVDVNGDGLVDWVRAYRPWNGSNIIATFLNTGSGWVRNASYDLPDVIYQHQAPGDAYVDPITKGQFVDVNGDGLLDFVRSCKDWNGNIITGTWLNTGSGWSRNTSYDMPDFVRDYSHSREWSRGQFADMNGDGLVDWVRAYRDTSGNYFKTTWLNTGHGWAANATYTLPDALFSHREGYRAMVRGRLLDINGDGLADYIKSFRSDYFGTQQTTYINNTNTGGGWVVSGSYKLPDYLIDTIDLESGLRRGELVDINGDGLPDWIRSYKDANGATAMTTFLNTGKGWAGTSAYNLPTYLFDHTFDSFGPQRRGILTDVNGDNLTDLVIAFVDINNQSSKDTWINTGNGWTKDTAYNLPDYIIDYWENAPAVTTGSPTTHGEFADINGDGLPDWVKAYGDIDGNLHEATYLGRTPSPDMLIKITDGADAQITINYLPITDDSVYTRGSGEVYPVNDIQSPLYVVSSARTDNGVGGTRKTSYHYSGAKVDLHGRGFLGFASISATDETSNVITTTYYKQDFPYIGFISKVNRSLTDGTLVGRADYTYDSILNYPGVEFPYISTSIENTFEINDGQNLNPVITVTKQNEFGDGFGNPTMTTVTTTGGNETFITQKINNYNNDSNNWFLGRLICSKVTQSSTTGSAVRTSGFEYSAATGLVVREVLEPKSTDIVEPAGMPDCVTSVPASDPSFDDITLITDYVHDDFGNIKEKIVSGDGIVSRTTTTTWGERDNLDNVTLNGRFPVTTINTVNTIDFETKQQYDGGFGVVIRMTDANDITTTMSYDDFGRQVRENRADGTKTTMTRSWCGVTCPQNAVLKLTILTDGKPAVLTYSDKLGREIRTETAGFDGASIYEDTIYDDRGRIKKGSRPYFKTDTPLWNSFTYDEVDRLKTATKADGSVTTTTYNGLETVVVNDKQQTTKSIHNARNELTTVINVDGDTSDPQNPVDIVTEYSYGPFGNLEQVVDHQGNLITSNYDIRGRKIKTYDPDTGIWFYEYNALDEMVRQTDAKGQITKMEYDQLGRMTRRTDDLGGPQEAVSNWTYDTFDTLANGQLNHSIGKLVQVSGGEGETRTNTYDSLGRLDSVKTTIDTVDYNIAQTYDEDGRIETISYPTGFQVAQSYAPSGYLARVCDHSQNAYCIGTDHLYWQAVERDAEGQLTEFELGNNVITRQTYTPQTGLIESITSSKLSSLIQDNTYQFDTLGNLKQRDDLIQGITETFDYDGLNRLTQSAIGASIKAFTYDAIGNIKTKTGISGTYQYGIGAGPHAVTSAGGQTFTYDANGSVVTGYNFTNNVPLTFTWTSYNKPRTISDGTTELTFSYGADRARFKQVNNAGHSKLYIGNLYEKEIAAVDTHIHYIRAGDNVVAIYKSWDSGANEINYLHRDHLGSVSAITDANGQLVENLSFDSHGKRRLADWQDGTPVLSGVTDRGYTGHEHLDDVGIIHMNGRVYDPEIGRFMSADPIIQDMTNPQTINPYTYVLNNPLSFTDPSGFVAECTAINTPMFQYYESLDDLQSGGSVQLTRGGEVLYVISNALVLRNFLDVSPGSDSNIADGFNTTSSNLMAVQAPNGGYYLMTLDYGGAKYSVDENRYISVGKGTDYVIGTGWGILQDLGDIALTQSQSPYDLLLVQTYAPEIAAQDFNLRQYAPDSPLGNYGFDMAPVAEILGPIFLKGLSAIRNIRAVSSRAGRVVPKAAGQKPIIVGENMKRVKEYADKTGGHAYRPWKNDPFDFELGMKRNERWIKDQMRNGREIIDIGPDFQRRAATGRSSPFYEMERRNLNGYDNYNKAFERNGSNGGVPGLDF